MLSGHAFDAATIVADNGAPSGAGRLLSGKLTAARPLRMRFPSSRQGAKTFFFSFRINQFLPEMQK
jgi:hypothetical protein